MGPGNDYADGGEGNDSLDGGGGGIDHLIGGFGDDSLFDVRGLDSTVLAGEQQDTIADILEGGSGDDFLSVRGSYNQVFGGSGNDTLTLNGGVLPVDASYNLLDGGSGDNKLTVDRANATLTNGEGFSLYEITSATFLQGYTVVIKGNIPDISGSSQLGVLYLALPRIVQITDIRTDSFFQARYDRTRNALILIPKTATFTSVGTAASSGALVIENYYDGVLGITGVPDAPLAPWDSLPLEGQNKIFLPLVTGSAQAASTQGRTAQEASQTEMRHPLAAAYPEQVAYTRSANVAEAALGLLPLAGGGLLEGGLVVANARRLIRRRLRAAVNRRHAQARAAESLDTWGCRAGQVKPR